MRRLLVVAAAVVAQLDPAAVDLLVDVPEIPVVEVERLRELVDLREGYAAELLAAVDQRSDRAFHGVTTRPCHTGVVLTGSAHT